MRIASVMLLSLSLTGCAAAFRSSHEAIPVESTPAGAEVSFSGKKVGASPTVVEVRRGRGPNVVTFAKAGYEDNTASVKRSINPAWLVIDVLTCIIPVALCIPIIVDAASGKWSDLPEKVSVTMKPGTSATLAGAATKPTPTAAGTAAAPPSSMSESERKATARAAFMEGVALQDKNNCPEALPRFEAAQSFYVAPTHLLHIAQCQVATGKLLEASETYEALAHTTLEKGAPEAFKTAQDEGNKELTALRPRIPTLRVQVVPAASSLSQLVVKVNGNALPNAVLGIARPVNPGKYKLTAWAAGYKEAAAEVDVTEGSPKAIELKLAK